VELWADVLYVAGMAKDIGANGNEARADVRPASRGQTMNERGESPEGPDLSELIECRHRQTPEPAVLERLVNTALSRTMEPIMPDPISRRSFTILTSGAVLGSATSLPAADEKPKADSPATPSGPIEAGFERSYPAPGFKPSWKKPQINRLLVQDFVIYAHSELDMVKALLEKEPALLNATIDWGNGDWETGLGGASHMGRRDIVGYLLDRGARIDIFCAAMMGLVDAVKSFLTLEPKLIDAKGPHGFTLHFHAQVGGKEAEPVLAYLQSIKRLELKPVPFLKPPADTKAKSPT
jgi:hypothetical protein